MAESAVMLITEKTPETGIRQGGKSMRILVVDDESAMIDCAADLMRLLGHEPAYRAYDGENAVEVFTREQRNIDAVLMDVMMPRRNGVSAAAEIRRMDPAVKIILMSSNSENEVFASEIENAGFLRKPLVLETVAMRLAQK